MRAHGVPALLFLLLSRTAPAPSGPGPGPGDVPGPGPAPPSGPERRVPEIWAARATGPVEIDGRLDEPSWAAAEAATDFTQSDPDEGRPATERTEVRTLIGDDALYIGARLHDSEASKIQSRLARRDEAAESDLFEVFIDSRHDRLTASRFRVNPAGAVRDAAIGSDGSEDASWDPVWESEARVDSSGWTVEMRIPLSQLRYNAVDDGTWGIQFARMIRRKQEVDYFSFTPKKEEGGVRRYGLLRGLGRLPAPRRLELLPYTLGKSRHRHVAPGDPFQDPNEFGGALGFDLKYGLASNLTLDGTVNPDFGQVEVDPAVVNLSAFETFFPEKRPFFIEGADLFQFGSFRAMNSTGNTRFFHSRRIGRAPQRAPQGANFRYVDAPEASTIGTAWKLTGKTAGGWSVGALEALTIREEARFLDTLGVRRETPVEPLTNYFAGRIRRDLRGGDTVLGGMATLTRRDLSDPDLARRLRRTGLAGGLDWSHAWADRTWSLDGFFAGSWVEGSEEAIARTQLSSARYYQRPDAGHVSYDPTRTRLAGYANTVALMKNAGTHWLGSLAWQETSPGFEVNDLGFLSRADRRAISPIVLYKEDRPGGLHRRWNAFVYTNHIWNGDGDKTYEGFAASGDLTFRNYWGVSPRFTFTPRVKNDQLTRGGPLAESPAGTQTSLGIWSDSRRSWSWNGWMSWERDEEGGWAAIYETTIALRPSPSLSLSVSPSFSRSHGTAQYVTRVEDPLATGTYGSRYVFAGLDQTSLSFGTRVNWTFTPHLSFQVYAQPLVAAGDYRNFKEFAKPRGFAFDEYGRDRGTIERDASGTYVVDPDGPEGGAPAFSFGDPDFNFRSLLGNAVLRWEYRPGSALFLVWQQSREDVPTLGTFDLSRDYSALFRIRPENFFVLKATYWMGL